MHGRAVRGDMRARPGTAARFTMTLMATTALAGWALSIPHAQADIFNPRTEVVAFSGTELAQSANTVEFDIPAGPLASALDAFSNATGWDVGYASQLAAGKTSPGVSGTLSPADALQQLLAGSGLFYQFSGADAVTLSGPDADGTTVLAPITVEGQSLSDSGRTEGTNSYAGSQVSVGSKTQTSIREIPQSVSVVTRQRLDDQNITTLQDAMKNTTGMTVERFDGAGNFNTINARGYQADTILLDGVPTNSNGNQATGLDTAIYDRIEVLRGPAGLFQGAGEPGATINMVRKRPGKEIAIMGGATTGSWDTYRGVADASVPLIDSGKARARFVVVRDERESYIDVIESEKFVGYGTIELDIASNTTLSLGATYQEIDSVLDQGLPAYSNGTLADVDRSSFTGANWNDQDLETKDFFAELQHNLDNGGRLQVSARRFDRDMRYKGARANGAIDPSTGNFNIQTLEYGFGLQSTALDAYGTTPFNFGGQTHNIVLGVDYRKERNQRAIYQTGPNYTSNIFNPNHNIPEPTFSPNEGDPSFESEYGAYGQLRVQPIDWATILVGSRLSWWEATSSTSKRRVDEEITPYAGLVIDLNNEISAYGSYASIFQPQSQTDVSGSYLAPRTGNQYEVGLKGEFLDGGVLAHLAVYRIEDQNRAMTDPSNAGSSIASGEVRSQGIEAEISGQPIQGWDLVAGYAFTQTEYLTATVSDQGETFATFTPEHSINLWSKYSFSGGELDGLSIGGGLKLVSEFYSESSGVNFTSEGYGVVSAQLGYQLTDNLSGTLTVTNLLDRTYYEKVSGNSRQNFYGEPRTFMLTVKGEW